MRSNLLKIKEQVIRCETCRNGKWEKNEDVRGGAVAGEWSVVSQDYESFITINMGTVVYFESVLGKASNVY